MDEFSETFADWLTETVVVRTYQGIGPKGPILSAPVTVGPNEGGVMVKDGNRLVRTKWAGGVLGPDEKIYGIPFDSTDILVTNHYRNAPVGAIAVSPYYNKF